MDEITCELTKLYEERKKLQKKLTSINREIERLEMQKQPKTFYTVPSQEWKEFMKDLNCKALDIVNEI